LIFTDRFHYTEGFCKKCESALDLAFEHVPLYQGWKKFDPGRGASLDARFDALPALTKADMRAVFPTGLMPDTMNLQEGLLSGEIEYTFTSGTTSEKVVNIWNQHWWNRSEAASWKLNRFTAGLPYPQRTAKLASSLNVGISCEEDLPMDYRVMGDTLYLNEKTSVLQWQPRHYKRMAAELNAFRPVVLEANPSLLARLAYWIADNGAQVYSPKVIVFTFELPSAMHLEAIQRVFCSARVSSYGTTETGFVMQQCDKGLMHQNADFCRIDFKPLKKQFGGPNLGRIFVTTFDNPWNCVVRFDSGDLIRLSPNSECGCGIGEGMIAEAVEGRVSNVTFRTDGGLVTAKMLDDRLAGAGSLRDYHLEQTGGCAYCLQAMLAPGSNEAAESDKLRGALETVYGQDGDFTIQIMDAILPGPAGKFRRTQANFKFDESVLFE